MSRCRTLPKFDFDALRRVIVPEALLDAVLHQCPDIDTDLGERWLSRLVATAAEERLSI
jgi:hypothetical protein